MSVRVGEGVPSWSSQNQSFNPFRIKHGIAVCELATAGEAEHAHRCWRDSEPFVDVLQGVIEGHISARLLRVAAELLVARKMFFQKERRHQDRSVPFGLGDEALNVLFRVTSNAVDCIENSTAFRRGLRDIDEVIHRRHAIDGAMVNYAW